MSKFIPIALLIGSAGADEATLRRFKTEYPSASKKLETFYTNLRIAGTVTSKKGTSKWEFCGNEQSQRMVSERKDGTSTVWVANRKLSFDLKKPAGSSRYAVTMMGPATPEVVEKLVRSIHLATLPAHAPFSIVSDSIVSFLTADDVKFTDAHEVAGPNGKSIKVDWELSMQKGPNLRGTFDFAGDGSWALHGYDYYFVGLKDPKTGEPQKIGRHVAIDYDGQKDGVPLVKRVRTWHSLPSGNENETDMEVTLLEPGPVPQSEFELAAFGISTDPVAEQTPVAYYLLALSAMAAIASFIFLYLRRRSEKIAVPA